jgi:hypothetical protein
MQLIGEGLKSRGFHPQSDGDGFRLHRRQRQTKCLLPINQWNTRDKYQLTNLNNRSIELRSIIRIGDLCKAPSPKVGWLTLLKVDRAETLLVERFQFIRNVLASFD